MSDLVTPELLSAFCHELRGPLGAISNWAHVLGVPEADASVRERALQSLTADVRALGGVINELSSLASSLSAPRATLPIEAGPFLRGLVEAVAQENGRETRLLIADPSLRLLGDPTRLRELLRLFLNADTAVDELAVTAEGERVMVDLTLAPPHHPRPLALALARALAEHQGGDLLAGAGAPPAHVRLRLPRAT